MARCGINGNFHSLDQQLLYSMGLFTPTYTLTYQGCGDWINIPYGGEIRHVGEDDWTLTLLDGTEICLWTEE